MTECALPILILAAGQSSRMRGRDKLLEDVGGQPLLSRQIGIAEAATSGPVLVTLPQAPHPRYGCLDRSRAQAIPVPDAAEGLSASLRRGVQAVPAEAQAVMILLADLPALTTEDLEQVFKAVDAKGRTLIWRGATEAGKPGHPIIFARSLFSNLQAMQGDTGGADVIAAYADQMQLIRLPGCRARLDLDTPEDWVAWRSGRK